MFENCNFSKGIRIFYLKILILARAFAFFFETIRKPLGNHKKTNGNQKKQEETIGNHFEQFPQVSHPLRLVNIRVDKRIWILMVGYKGARLPQVSQTLKGTTD